MKKKPISRIIPYFGLQQRVIYIILCCWSIFGSYETFAQKYFNDTLHFDSDNTTLLSMALPTDSGIYVAGGKFMDSTGNIGYTLLGFLDTLGNSREVYSDYDIGNYQILMASTYKLFTNTSGNFVLAYANVEDSSEYPRIKEISPAGQLIRDVKLDSIIGMGMFVLDFTRLYQHQDSSYWLWSVTSFIENAPPDAQKAGPLLTILHPDFSVDTIIRYYFDPNKKWDYYFTDEVELDSGKTAVLVQNTFYPPGHLEDAIGVVALLILNSKGQILNSYYYTDNSLQGSGATSMIKSLDGNSLIVLHNEENRHGDSTTLLVYVSKFNYSLQLQSQTLVNTTDLLTEEVILFFGSKRVIATSDSNYLTLCTDFPYGSTNQTAERICKVSPTGEIVWKRDFYYLNDPDPTVFSGNYHDMSDVRECPDGGFVFPGQIMGNTFQTAWLVKTNCLGFLGPPEAAFAYKNSKTADSTFFYNTSIQAGNYHWDFGDGTSYDTGENEDTLLHQYADTGVYHATLIAYGCNGETDTLRFDVHASPQKDSVLQAGEGYFAFYPNPIVSGGMLYVYINGANEASGSTIELTFYDTAGKTAQNTRVSSKEGNYLIPNTLSSGMYFVHLTQNGNNIAVKKLVVK